MRGFQRRNEGAFWGSGCGWARGMMGDEGVIFESGECEKKYYPGSQNKNQALKCKTTPIYKRYALPVAFVHIPPQN